MSYYFFLSYKRSIDTPYVNEFFKDLSKEVAGQLELNSDSEVGFFDQEDIELGQNWEPTIAKALQESAVLVCAYTPRYFESEYCGREWQVFQMRRERYQKIKQLAGDKNVELPPVIKPVIWQSVTFDPGLAINAVQYVQGNLQAMLQEKVLRSVVLKKKFYEDIYGNYIEALATQIIQTAKDYRLPQLENLPPLSEVPSAFTRTNMAIAPVPQPSMSGTISSTKYVRFIFVAANPATFLGERQAEFYGARGSDWKPFHPDLRNSIGLHLQHFVSSEEVGFESDIVEFGENLVSVVQQAYDERKIVVLVVDGWTVSWDENWRNILADFDQNHKPFYNCTVLVPWNLSDLEIQGQRDNILQNVRDTFDSRANLWKNEIFYRDSITTVDRLLDALRSALESIRGEMHKRAQERKPVPAGISKPVVSNQVSQASGSFDQ